jgi:hypothetical protein
MEKNLMAPQALIFPPPRFVWEPLIIVAAGLAHYYWAKYVNPYPDDLIERLNSFSITGTGGEKYRPQAGIVIAIIGLIAFVVFNFSWAMQLFG